MGPNFQRPAAPAVNGYARELLPAKTASAEIAGGEEQRFVPDEDIPEQWWTLFQSPQLNALIEKALKTSPTLVAAQAALRQAVELVYAQQGAFFPTLQAGFAPSRQKTSNALSPPLSTNQLLYNLFTTQVTVGFTPDVFGLNRRQVESLQAQANSQRFQLQAAYVTLTSNVVSAAMQEASLRAQIAAEKGIIEIITKSLELVRQQFELGYAARLDVAAQESALAQAEQALRPLQKQLVQNRDLLIALAGGFPSDDLEETFDLTALRLPQELPVSLPSKLVEQRPDVRAAEEQIHAASAEIGVAVANGCRSSRSAPPTAARRPSSPRCSLMETPFGVSQAMRCRRFSRVERCCTSNARRRQLSTKRRLNTGARSSLHFRTWRTRSMRFRTMRRA